ncbi:parasitic phase-specific protein PSP-1 [Truncatella angustata]|uniref:Parasitic phase-specific protein PSP-1 n=1 Tax=Truncatella angustata TaxID=152316 RepID=A0A9P8ZZB9_9PEZI|nr:parasitic phase-specific protein PSP-1 [Truncatella angustata]KAH6656032.1 parasitic phase-specific protein PSP-1 [Truncatella angustata]
MSTVDGAITFGPDANCTLEICPLESSILQYQPSVPANVFFIAFFGLAIAAHSLQGIQGRTWGFVASMVSGCILEVVGYAGRLIIHDNPFDFAGFLIQIICITIAPVFFCSAIYVLLSQVIIHIDPQISRFSPRLFYWIFIPCDIASLILQATGGALSCVGTSKDDIKQGEDISLAGLVFQVFTLVVFLGLFADYLAACARATSAAARGRITPRVKVFLAFLLMSVVLILVRCAYRIVELQGGYFSETFRDEGLFIGLESGVMCLAVVCLNIGHPSVAFGGDNAERKSGLFELQERDEV